jgi:hypothetical protein
MESVKLDLAANKAAFPFSKERLTNEHGEN